MVRLSGCKLCSQRDPGGFHLPQEGAGGGKLVLPGHPCTRQASMSPRGQRPCLVPDAAARPAVAAHSLWLPVPQGRAPIALNLSGLGIILMKLLPIFTSDLLLTSVGQCNRADHK